MEILDTAYHFPNKRKEISLFGKSKQVMVSLVFFHFRDIHCINTIHASVMFKQNSFMHFTLGNNVSSRVSWTTDGNGCCTGPKHVNATCEHDEMSNVPPLLCAQLLAQRKMMQLIFMSPDSDATKPGMCTN